MLASFLMNDKEQKGRFTKGGPNTGQSAVSFSDNIRVTCSAIKLGLIIPGMISPSLIGSCEWQQSAAAVGDIPLVGAELRG